MNKQQVVEIRTVEQLRAFLTTHLECEITNEDLIWGNAIYKANLILRNTPLEDIALMAMNGVAAANTISDVQETINTLIEDVENGDVRRLVRCMLGVQHERYDLSLLVDDLFEEKNSNE